MAWPNLTYILLVVFPPTRYNGYTAITRSSETRPQDPQYTAQGVADIKADATHKMEGQESRST
jgi:hypothetical protein